MLDIKNPKLRIVKLSSLRPTQLTVGMLQVKHKRERLQAYEKRPAELINFILGHPIRVVLGPADKAYVIDHHHLALALIKEDFETAPMEIEDDFSALASGPFWKKMAAKDFLHLVDADGKNKKLTALPKNLKRLEDDPYRSLAGFVREAGGFRKVQTPFAEFLWADYYRARIREKLLDRNFQKALSEALRLAAHKDARSLPGYVR